MKQACLLFAIVLLCGVARAQYHDLGYGEPYELAGKRMVFTTW